MNDTIYADFLFIYFYFLKLGSPNQLLSMFCNAELFKVGWSRGLTIVVLSISHHISCKKDSWHPVWLAHVS